VNIILTHLPPKPGSSSSLYAGRPIVTSALIEAFFEYAPENRIIIYTPPGLRAEYQRYTNDYSRPDKLELLDAEAIERSIGLHEPAVIHTFTTSLRYAFHLRWLCGSRPWPVIGMTHDLSSCEVFEELLLAHVVPPAPYDTVVCISKCAYAVARSLIDKVSETLGYESPLQLPIIPHGVELSLFKLGNSEVARKKYGLDQNHSILLYLGRISDTMKADLIPLLTAFSRVRHKPAPVLVIAGGVSCPREEDGVKRINSYIAELKLENNVQILTNITPEQRIDLLSAADILVNPSDSLQESFGLVLLEAMAAGLPIIASDWNGFRDIIKDTETGFLIETVMPKEGFEKLSGEILHEDRFWWYGGFSQSVAVNINQFSDAVSKLVENPELAHRMGVAGRNRVERKFQWKHIVSIYKDEWDRLTTIAMESDYSIPASPYSYLHAKVFESHPTHLFDGSTTIRKIEFEDHLLFTVENPPSFLSSKILSDILASITIPTCVNALDLPASKRNRHVAYLLKQGLAEIVND